MSTPAPPMTTLFEKETPHPLADLLRPQRLADVVGQNEDDIGPLSLRTG